MGEFYHTFTSSTYIVKLMYMMVLIMVLMYWYFLTMAVVWRLYGGCIAEVWRKSHYAQT
jgi:hypothetical protein